MGPIRGQNTELQQSKMSFEAVIDSQENKMLWCRCIHTLSALSEDICFVATASQLVVSASNTGDTTLTDIIFQAAFFKKYSFDASLVEEGLREVKGEQAYALTVRSKLLSMLFKKQEDDIDNFNISFDASEACPVNKKFRLQIEVTTKTAILKRFAPFYNPVAPEMSRLADWYKEDLIKQKAEGHHRPGGTNYIMLSNGMLKNFLDNVNSQTEHLKIEVNQQIFSLLAFTRGVYIKEREILKQPMAVQMQFRTEDLHAYELGEETNSITLRLKDFKGFLSLGSASEMTDCYFKSAGDPILFELAKNNVTIQTIQDTDGENHITTTATEPIKKAAKQRTQARPIQAQTSRTQDTRAASPAPERVPNATEVTEEPLFVAEDDDYNDEHDLQNDPNDNYDYANHEETPQPTEEEEAQITWGDPAADSATLRKLMSTRKQVIEDARTEYMAGLKKRKMEQQKEKERAETVEAEELEELGPTQNIPRVKGLFD